MTRPVAGREAGAYLALVTAGSIAVAVALPQNGAAPLLSAIIPVVALLILTPVLGRSTWSNLGLSSTGLRQWPIALAVPVGVAALAYSIGVLTGLVGGVADLRILSVLTNIMLGTLLVLGEEVGWRGFLLPRVQQITSRRTAALVTGFAHALVHLPLILLTTTYNSEGSRWVVAPLTVVTITAAGVFYAWLRDSSGSIWPAALAHSAGNTLVAWIATAVIPGQAAAAAQFAGEGGLLPAVAMSTVAGLLLVRARVWQPGVLAYAH